MSSKKIFSLIIIILLSWVCLVYLQQDINRMRERDFIGTTAVTDDVPPVVAFTTVALGGFRGIAADILWLKTISLQEEGKYFEMVQLAFWILKLQPKSTGAVAFLSWNMAYNISVIFAEPEKKWQWVENGINLLRNAIRYNPKNASLCRELAWIYINKIGDRYDSSNLYYKTKLAFDMEKIIGLEEFGLEVEKIIEINKKFGELDWRLYSSLAIYWSYVGLSISKDNRECHKALNTALAAAVLHGQLLFIDNSEYNDFTTCPNFSAYPIINNYFLDQLAGENRDDYANFYFSFANKMIPVLYLYGKYEEAKLMFNKLKNLYPVEMGNVATFEVFLDSYWNNYFKENNKEQVLDNIFQNIKISYLLNKRGMLDMAENLKNSTQQLYDRYSRDYFNSKLPEFQTFYDRKILVISQSL